MAAVAGSKGRITLLEGFALPSFQAGLAGRLFAGDMTVLEAANALLANARLREVGVDTNMVCNLKCSYCYLDDRDESKGRIDPATWASHLEKLVGAGCKLVAFIGKEPLGDAIALDTIEILNRLPKRRSFRIGMVTNGTFIDRRLDRLVAAKLDYLDVSLDAVGSGNDAHRGAGVFERVSNNLKRYLNTEPKHDFSITSVLRRGSAEHYVDFVDYLFSIGIKTAFGSPILKFTERDTAGEFAVSVNDLMLLLNKLSTYLQTLPAETLGDNQVIIDLPYKYSWAFLEAGITGSSAIKQDAYEAHFWQPHGGLPLYVKFNFFPMSFWRAVRVTHDGQVLENMDLAAHRLYLQHSRACADSSNRWYFGERSFYHRDFLEAFIEQHCKQTQDTAHVYDRDVAQQLEHMMAYEPRQLLGLSSSKLLNGS
jgi:MoaA/NifB/PqqE/SkfB family radical SAM enzyme